MRKPPFDKGSQNKNEIGACDVIIQICNIEIIRGFGRFGVLSGN